MLPSRLFLLLAALFAPALAFAQTDGLIWRFVFPRATALISIDWQRLRQSQAGSIIRDKLLATKNMPAIPGIQLLNDIDRVVISSSGNNPPVDSGEPPLLIVLRGRFDAAKVRQISTRFGTPQSYDSFEVYRPQGANAKKMAWVLFDAETILFGDAPSIFAALNRNQFASPPPETAAIIARAAELDANYEVWAMLKATEVMSSDRLAALLPGGEWVSEARGFEAGLNFRAGLTADILVRFSSEDTAKHMTAELARVMAIMAKDKSAGAQIHDILRKLKFSVDGSAAKISLRLTPLELERSAQAFAASHQASPPVAGKPAPPMVPLVIRIEGLDEGIREIPYREPQH